MSNSEMNNINSFIKLAATDGVDSAIQAHGHGLPLAEIDALKTLTPAEFQALDDINSKITDASGFTGDNAWICGAVC